MPRNKFVPSTSSTPVVKPTTHPGSPNQGKSAKRAGGSTMAQAQGQQQVSLPAGKPLQGHTVTNKNCY